MRTRGVLSLRRYTTGPARTADLDRSDGQARWSWALSDFVLDQYLPPCRTGCRYKLFEASVINQAIGALIGQGFTLERAERHLTAAGADAGISRHAVGLRIPARLTARYPLIACSVNRVGNPASPG